MDPTLLAALFSAGGNMLQGMGKGSPGSTGYDTVNFNDPYDETSRRMSSMYMQDVLSALRAGQTPDWLNRFTDPLQADLLRQNRNQMFGREGMPGGSIMDAAMSTGAMTGVGGQAAQAPANKALADYADRTSGINQYIASLKNNYMQTASQNAPQQLYTMGTRQNAVVPIQQPGSQDDPLMQGIGGMLGKVDFSKIFGNGRVAPQQTFSLAQGPQQWAAAPYQGQGQYNYGY